MNFAAADEVVRAVLYEGYVLYPYRPSSIKNRQRWTFGGIYPGSFPSAGPAQIETQGLVEGTGETKIETRVRFLQPIARQIFQLPKPLPALSDDAEAGCRPVQSMSLDGHSYHAWEEAVEREVVLATAVLHELANEPLRLHFAFAAEQEREAIVGPDGLVHGVIVRRRAAIEGAVTLKADAADPAASDAWRLTACVDNLTAAPPLVGTGSEAAALRGFMSTHIVLGVEGGAFVSLIDPPLHRAKAAQTCLNRSAWPVLVGPEGATDTLLCSPIILYDHPKIAPESVGDLFDGTEIDEILTLRILTMTDAEKAEMAGNDERARALLARTEALSEEQMQRLHGVMRSPRLPGDELPRPPSADLAARSPAPRLAMLNDSGLALRVGDRVRLCPRAGADIMDLALAGQAATIEGIEVDFDQRVHVAVTIDADPGRDLGMERLPGHRFFFAPDEIEACPVEETAP